MKRKHLYLVIAVLFTLLMAYHIHQERKRRMMMRSSNRLSDAEGQNIANELGQSLAGIF